MVPNSVVLNVAVLPLREPEAVNLRARLRAGMTPGRPAGDPREVAADAAARRAADHARGARRRGGGGADRGHAARRLRGPSPGRASCSSIVSRETRSRRERDAVAQEQLRVALEHAAAARARPAARARRRRGSAAPRRPRARRRRAVGESDRNSSSTSPAASSCAVEVRAALAEQRAHAEALAQLGERRRQVEPPVARGAHVVDLGGAAAGRLAAEAVRITTRAAGSASSGMSASQREAPGDDARERLLAAGPRATALPRGATASGMIRP